MSSPSRLILCPGQGAQFVGMGKAWFDKSPEARAVFERADALLGDRLGGPLSRLCFEGGEGGGERLNRTDASQPAIYVTSIACWHGLLASWRKGGAADVHEANVAATAGLSLGEYTALHIAGAFTFEQGLELVLLRGRAMQDAADAMTLPESDGGGPGSGMVALIGADEAQAREICRFTLENPAPFASSLRHSVTPSLPDTLVPANFNCPGQVVLSGSIAACHRAVEVAAQNGIRAQPLQVAGAFHSPLMAPAAERLAAALKSTPIKPPRCPVMSNVTGHAHDAGGLVGGGRTIEDSIRARLVEQLTSPVRWEQNCRTLLASHSGPAAEWHELAPGRSLMGMMRRTDKAAKVETHDEP